MQWLRGGFVIFFNLSVIYIVLSLYSRWQCRLRLGDEFDRGGIDGTRDDYISSGLKDYDQSLRRKLILGVYIIPMLIVGTLIYVINFM